VQTLDMYAQTATLLKTAAISTGNGCYHTHIVSTSRPI